MPFRKERPNLSEKLLLHPFVDSKEGDWMNLNLGPSRFNKQIIWSLRSRYRVVLVIGPYLLSDRTLFLYKGPKMAHTELYGKHQFGPI